MCFFFEWAVTFVGLNHMVGGLPIALARLYYLFQGNRLASYVKVRDLLDQNNYWPLIRRIGRLQDDNFDNFFSDDLDLSVQGGHPLENPLLVLPGALCNDSYNEYGGESGRLRRKELLVPLQVLLVLLNKITKKILNKSQKMIKVCSELKRIKDY